MYRIQDWLAENEVTGIITARAIGNGGAGTMSYSFLEFMADCVVHLGQYATGGIAHRALQVAKYRGSAVHEGVFPLVIGNTGLNVSNPPPKDMAYPASSERVSSGVERLDAMLTGGYFRGSTVLVTGAPGTCKSTLGAAFAEASCKRGERCLFVSFDESASEIVRNMATIHVDLATQVAAGRLYIHAVRTASLNAEQHFMQIKALMDEYQPTSLVVDPLSAVTRSATAETLLHVPLRLVYLTKSRGISMFCTSLVDNSESPESTEMNVSTIADTWIHLSYRVQSGERNRLLSIVKSRGAGHSRQARELVLSGQGVTLSDVYVSGGEVLMGTLRWEKEEAQRFEKAQERRGMLRRARQLSLAESEVKGRIEALNRELELRRAESEAVAEDIRLDMAQRDASTAELGRMRGVDMPPTKAMHDEAAGTAASRPASP
jgi:circadian clock protein KaiC